MSSDAADDDDIKSNKSEAHEKAPVKKKKNMKQNASLNCFNVCGAFPMQTSPRLGTLQLGYHWGVNEEMLMENLPEDLQREIRRHLFKFVKKVQIFQLLDEPIIDAICERLRTKTYIEGSKILFRGGLVDKMVFIIRGKMESIGEDLIVLPLSEGDVCGEELLTWCLEHSSVNADGKRIRIPGHRLLSNRLVRCLTNVEAFVLRAADLEEVANLFARFLRNPLVQGAIRYVSPYWRALEARRIQVAWRYRKKRLARADSSSPPRN